MAKPLLSYNLALSRQMIMVKFFWVISRVEWLNGEQANISRTISSLILRVMTQLGIHSFFYIPAEALCLLQQRTQSLGRYTKDGLDPQPRHNPEDEDRDGAQNIGLFTVQPLDLADNLKELHYITVFIHVIFPQKILL
jgi:hypothetical protein